MLEHRQGDVGLVRWPALPPGCTQVERAPGEAIVLAEGEATGHAHVIAEATVALWEATDGKRYVEVPQGSTATLVHTSDREHPDHWSQIVQPGVYQVRHQREYVPGAFRTVGD